MHIGFWTKTKSILKWAILGCTLTLALTWALLKTPILTPTLKIETLNFPGETSQLFYKKLSSYSEQNSAFAKLDSSRTTFQFRLPLYDDELRWDPLEKAGTFYLKSVSINLLAYRKSVSLDDVNPTFELQKGIRNNRTVFVAPPGSIDPQIRIRIDSEALDIARISVAFVLAVLITLATLIWVNWHTAILAFAEKDTLWIKQLKNALHKDQFSASEFIILFGIGIALNLIPVTSFFLSVDDEVGAYRTDPSAWISDGRWTAFLVEKFIFPLPVLPFAPNLFFYACLAISYMVILRAHNLKFNWATALAYCVFVAHPIWWFIGEFYSNLPSAGLGVMCLSIAVYITTRLNLSNQFNRTKILLMIIASLCLALAVGAYQSLIMFYMVIGIGSVIFAFKDKTTEQTALLESAFKRVSYLIAVFLAGLALYFLLNKIAKHFYPANYGYLDSFLRIDALITDPLLIFSLTFEEMFKIYTGSERAYGVAFFSSAVALGFSILFLVTQKTWVACLRMTLFICALLISPFLLHFVTGGAYLPLRSMLAISFISWMSVMVILQNKGALRIFGVALTSILIFQMITINGQYAASTILATTHDRLTAQAIYSRIAEVNPNFDRDTLASIDIYGKLSFVSRYPSPSSSTMSASFFDWDDGNANRMIRYMQLIGFQNLSVIHPTQRIELTPKFKDMPIWPAPGSVRLEDGVYLIKLSETPDPTHAQYKQTGL
ncbi:glucosyltransferase domain-containing protein [Pseudomonas frederiksbergensis]|uniref:Glucosyl transferase GtrII n=1 Tax=Pseudomonas frederiksbergensis TaxID=104087 RepID=A0A0B1Z425_9PSED|nr:glucosyltransferase domain-containing protein [Pseudomonas frederiksbergensis]KHK65799.1 hypothetical protein JZ00_03185 [Pseudomonas frederiksbergensis]